MVRKFKRKPVVVEAVQFTGDNVDELHIFAGIGTLTVISPTVLGICTLEDGQDEYKIQHIASLNDWIVKGVKGEYWAVKPDIFEMTYEEVVGDA